MSTPELTGDVSPQQNFATAINMALDEALAEDPAVIVFGEDVADPQGGGVTKCTQGLSTKYGPRVRSTPISEQAIVGAAVGAAIVGMRPVAEIMLMNFMAVAMDQIVNHAAKLRFMSGGQTGVPLTIRTMAGVVGGNGAQHSDMVEAWFAHSPGLKVVVPSRPDDAKGLLLSCIFDDDPCIFVETLSLYFGTKGSVGESGQRIPIGRARILKSGTDLTVVGYGKPIVEALSVAERLEREEGCSIEVIDLRTVSPWDEGVVLDSVGRSKRAVLVHEAVQRFGVGAEVAARIHEELFGELEAPVARVGSAFTPVPYAPTLEAAYVAGTPGIEAAIRNTLG
ncbi:MAG: alpha-ketoacid dehydrogenase subunit beta [Acidimicrobiales bacterium]|jgi:pyruvate/2-oxoglutarate/acetoin dehydrogenase E1 component|nr:alpha-ketoacid dehydrogenase subunit beta [Acidimicrobiales bacterium]